LINALGCPLRASDRKRSFTAQRDDQRGSDKTKADRDIYPAVVIHRWSRLALPQIEPVETLQPFDYLVVNAMHGGGKVLHRSRR